MNEEHEARAKFVLSRLKVLRQREGLTIARLAREPELCNLIKLQQTHLVLKFFDWATDSLGAGRKAVAVRAALAINMDEPRNLTERRQAVANSYKRDADSVKLWESQGMQDLAHFIANYSLNGWTSLPQEIEKPKRVGSYLVNHQGIATLFISSLVSTVTGARMELYTDPLQMPLPKIVVFEPQSRFLGTPILENELEIFWPLGRPPFAYAFGRRGYTFHDLMLGEPAYYLKERVQGDISSISLSVTGVDPGNIGIVFSDTRRLPQQDRLISNW